MPPAPRFSLDQLEDAAQVPGRQIRELIRVGILPAPSSRGRGATYGPEHLERLRAWKRLRAESPAVTTNDQLRALLDRLQHAGVLTGIAEGTVPLTVVGDREDEGQGPWDAAATGASFSRARLTRHQPQRVNEEALAYLSAMKPVAPPPPPAARLALEPSQLTPTLEVDLRAGEHSTAGLLLGRLRAALDAFAAGFGKTERVNPPRADAWHRVAIGRDLEISARAPLTQDEIQLLETVGQLLQQAIYRRDKK